MVLMHNLATCATLTLLASAGRQAEMLGAPQANAVSLSNNYNRKAVVRGTTARHLLLVVSARTPAEMSCLV